jgi:hypothetical protein
MAAFGTASTVLGDIDSLDPKPESTQCSDIVPYLCVSKRELCFVKAKVTCTTEGTFPYTRKSVVWLLGDVLLQRLRILCCE